MTNETRQRIEAYKKALPDMRERVMSVAILLVMSITMMTSATFAWLTLSKAPEVTGMQTTVAANGNLEIALAQGSISETAVAPGDSQVGDSSAAEGQSIVEANVTWGNLVNVSDPKYGISNIALRPALLSDFNRTEYPLNGATYGGDGRVVTTNDRYEYASYEKLKDSDKYYFAAGADSSGKSLVNYGVRAIASLGYTNLTGSDRLTQYYEDTSLLYQTAQDYYGKIVSNNKNDVNTLNQESGVTCISALEGIVTVFAQDKINQMGHGPDGDAGVNSRTSCSPYLWYLYEMMVRLETVLTDEGIALLELVNWQAYVHSGDDEIEKTIHSVSELLAKSETQLRNDLGLTEATISTIKSYKKDWDDLQFCMYGGTRDGKSYSGMKPMAELCSNPDSPENPPYYWEDIEKYINILVNINTATLAGKTLSSISGIGDALDIIGGGDVIVYGGVLKNIETRLINQKNRVKANVVVSVHTDVFIAKNPKINGVVYTDVGKSGAEPTYAAAVEEASGLVSTAKGEATAKDTYGLAIDLWARTNYPDAVLTLEGSAVYGEERATITVDGTEYDLYTMTVSEGEATIEIDIYQKDDKWYYANNHTEVEETESTKKEKYNPVVIGYEGENRVWEDWRDLLEGGYIEKDATTQGAGSCFVFYASTPTEQAKIKEMLKAFNVAFINQDGNILGTAQLNLESAYENQGKVTVPLEVITGTEYTDESGATRKGITRLTQNTPTMITAIVYLNGSELQNENVLAEGELQGQLNIQFGTDSILIAPDNEELQAQARTITAELTVDGTTIKNGTIGGEEGLEYKSEGYKATVNLTIDGEQPERISGFFVRVINATQGTRGEEKSFTRNEDGTWTAEFTLTNPGMYVFDTLLVDGVQYVLHDGTESSGLNTYYEANRPKVYIQGLRIAHVDVKEEPGIHMTAESSMEFPVEVKLDTAVMPKQVNAQFFNEDNSKQYTAILSYDSVNKIWVGSANINSSDTYTLKYISVDGQILDAELSETYTLYLGLRARVSTLLSQSEWEFDYTGPRQITMLAYIYDDSGAQITNIDGMQLYYNNVLSPAGMTWNGKAYEGQFNILQPGELTFQKLELGSVGTIRSTSSAPRFLAISLETPKYLNGQVSTPQTIIGGSATATMSVVMKDASTAQNVYARIVHDDSTELYVAANETSGDTRTFNLPKDKDGFYTLEKVYLQGVYDKEWVNAAGEKEGKFYTVTNKKPESAVDSTFMIMEATDNPRTEVLATYTVTVTMGGKEYSYKSTDNKTTEVKWIDLTPTDGAFLEGHDTGNIVVEIKDYKDRAISGVSSTSTEHLLEIQHAKDTTSEYGGYTGANGATTKFSTVTVAGSKITFAGTTLNHAGEYNTTAFKVKIGSSEVEIKVQPQFKISSVKPTVKITGISKSGNHYSKWGYTTSSGWFGSTSYTFKHQTVTSYISADGYTAEIYAVSQVDNSLNKWARYTQPTLSLTVYGMGESDSATLTLLKGDADSDIDYVFAADGQVTKRLGTLSDTWVGAHRCNYYKGHGSQTIKKMYLKKGENTYEVELDNALTIIDHTLNTAYN